MSRSKKKYPHFTVPFNAGVAKWYKNQANKKVRKADNCNFENRGNQSIKKCYESWSIRDINAVWNVNSPEKFYDVVKLWNVEIGVGIKGNSPRIDPELWKIVRGYYQK